MERIAYLERCFDGMGEDDEALDDDDANQEDPPEERDADVQPLLDHNEPD
jgi:hypothetical protein